MLSWMALTEPKPNGGALQDFQSAGALRYWNEHKIAELSGHL
jgi:hypothetical protein